MTAFEEPGNLALLGALSLDQKVSALVRSQILEYLLQVAHGVEWPRQRRSDRHRPAQEVGTEQTSRVGSRPREPPFEVFGQLGERHSRHPLEAVLKAVSQGGRETSEGGPSVAGDTDKKHAVGTARASQLGIHEINKARRLTCINY